MEKSVELGLFFVPQTILKDSMPYIHRIWQGYNVFHYNVQEKCWDYQLYKFYKNSMIKSASDKNGFIVIYLPKIRKNKNRERNKVSLKVFVHNIFNEYKYDNSKRKITLITTEMRTKAIESVPGDKTLTKSQALSLCISAFPANLIVDSNIKIITENSIIESLSPLEVDEFISVICNDYGYLLGWTNQKLLGEQYVKTNLEAVNDANFVVEMLSKIDVTALYKILGFYEEDDDEK